MSIDKRTPKVMNATTLPNPGPYIARIVNNVDPTKQGSLEVELLRPVGNQKEAGQQLFVVRYLSPFYGVTGIDYTGVDSYDFNHTQKSYGFWAVPPDTGCLVMVIFVDGDPGQGFWIGCVQDALMNHMIPGIAASTSVEQQMRDSDTYEWKDVVQTQEKYGTDFLPVGEINRASFRNGGESQQKSPNPDVEANLKPVHPIAEHILEQGLINDRVRGVFTSSARRESPSNVYGWSTPGPIDKRQKAQKGKVGRIEQKINKFVSRLGGHCIIMDDGDERWLRKTPPWEGPPEYADAEAGEEGLVNFPRDEAFRIRTRTGHQFLMHNSEDIIYLCNSRGTAWMEFTSNGKIEFYAKEGVSFRSESDFNFHGERDVNMHAGRSVNTYSTSTTTINSRNDVTMKSATNVFVNASTDVGLTSGNRCSMESVTGFDIKSKSLNLGSTDFDLHVGGSFFITADANIELHANNLLFTADGQLHLLSGQESNLQAQEFNIKAGGDIRLDSAGNTSMRSALEIALTSYGGQQFKADGAITINCGGAVGVKTTSTINLQSKNELGLRSTGGNIMAKGEKIHLNGDAPKGVEDALEAPPAYSAVEAHMSVAPQGSSTTGQMVSAPRDLVCYPNPGVGPSITKRAPTSEPFFHENQNPQGVTTYHTDNQNSAIPIIPGGQQYSVTSNNDSRDIPSSAGGYAEGGIAGGSAFATKIGGMGILYDALNFFTGRAPSIDDIVKYPQEWAKDKEFISAASGAGSALGIGAEDMLAIMFIITNGTMSPNHVHPWGQVGLFGLGDEEAQQAGTTTGELKELSRAEHVKKAQSYLQSMGSGFGNMPSGISPAQPSNISPAQPGNNIGGGTQLPTNPSQAAPPGYFWDLGGRGDTPRLIDRSTGLPAVPRTTPNSPIFTGTSSPGNQQAYPAAQAYLKMINPSAKPDNNGVFASPSKDPDLWNRTKMFHHPTPTSPSTLQGIESNLIGPAREYVNARLQAGNK